MKRLATVHTASTAYYSIKDVIDSIPAKTPGGVQVDPRLQFEPVADAQGMEYLAMAGYETSQAADAWSNVHRINSQILKEREQFMGAFAQQMRSTHALMEMNMKRMRQQLGSSGLVQTLSNSPPSRSQFLKKLTRLEEVKAAEKIYGAHKRKQPYVDFITQTLLPRAQTALKTENYQKAYIDFRILYDCGVKTAPVAYGIAKSKLGDFAFGASDAEKEQAEEQYKAALQMDSGYAVAHKALAELYEDWERYKEAAQAYLNYLKASPGAKDRRRTERKINVLQRKASR